MFCRICCKMTSFDVCLSTLHSIKVCTIDFHFQRHVQLKIAIHRKKPLWTQLSYNDWKFWKKSKHSNLTLNWKTTIGSTLVNTPFSFKLFIYELVWQGGRFRFFKVNFLLSITTWKSISLSLSITTWKSISLLPPEK